MRIVDASNLQPGLQQTGPDRVQTEQDRTKQPNLESSLETLTNKPSPVFGQPTQTGPSPVRSLVFGWLVLFYVIDSPPECFISSPERLQTVVVRSLVLFCLWSGQQQPDSRMPQNVSRTSPDSFNGQLVILYGQPFKTVWRRQDRLKQLGLVNY